MAANRADAVILLRYQDQILQAARTVDPGIAEVRADEQRMKVKLYRIPLDIFLTDDGLDTLHKALEA